MKIVNKKRFIISFSIMLLIVISLISFTFAKEERDIEIQNYTVSAGETLWSIALENKQEGQDIREYIYELRQLNNLEDCTIYKNQTIKIIK